jgi:DNA-binding response OmpR family regulator
VDRAVTIDLLPLRVVIADDDPDIRALVTIAVKRAGLDLVDSCSDGTSAWESLQAHAPDVAILDVAMPGMTGLEVCRLVRADARLSGIRILMLSAAVADRSRQAGLVAGADEYFIKPFSPRLLAERLSLLATGAAR